METTTASPPPATNHDDLQYLPYSPEKEFIYLPAIRQLISKDLSEPYSIYVYRYFLYQWGHLCFMALDSKTTFLIGVIVCKLEPHRSGPLRGYIAMLATRSSHRGQGIATRLVRMAIDAMIAQDADEIALETETHNTASLRIYENLGFLRTKRLHRYYLNGNMALRLVLYLKAGIPWKLTLPPGASGESGVGGVEVGTGGNGMGVAGAAGGGEAGEEGLVRRMGESGIEDVYGEREDLMGSGGQRSLLR